MRRGDGSLYDIVVPGYKANLSDVLASIALVQLDKLERHGEIRRRQFAAYDEAVAELEGIEPLARDPRDTHAYHLYVVRIDAERAGGTRDEYQRRLAEENIATSIHFLPVHTLTAYRDRLPGPAAAARRRAGRAPRSCRSRFPPRTRTPTSRTRSPRSRRVHDSLTDEPPAPRLLTLLVTGLCLAYLLWKIDLGQTLRVIADANPWYLLLALALMVVTILPMAWRWQLLLQREGRRGHLPWLTRAYFVSYAAGQILPTSVGGDAVRIYETARRHPGHGDTAAATVLLERAIGGAATLLLAAVGFLLAVGHYDVGAYLWIEAFFVVATIVLGFLLFSRRARPLLKLGRPVLAWVRLDTLVARVYHAIHSYRDHVGVLFVVFFVTLGVQAIRVLAVWLSGEAVGIDLSPRPYYVMGPLLFLVMLVPFTVNGFAVRESFFVSFLGKLGVEPRPGVRRRLPLLRDHDPDGGSRCGDPRLGGRRARPRARSPSRSRWLTKSARSSSRTTRRRGSSARSTACAGRGRGDRRRQRLDRRDARDRAREVPGGAADRAGEPRLRRRQQRGHARRVGRYFLLLNPDAWLTDGALEASSPSRTSTRRRPSSARGC